MKWHGYWWGVVLLAEGKEDAELLKKLKASLPHRAAEKYDDGVLKAAPGPFADQFGGETDCTLYLEFDR